MPIVEEYSIEITFQGAFPIILGHEGGGIVKYLFGFFKSSTLIILRILGRICWRRRYQCEACAYLSLISTDDVTSNLCHRATMSFRSTPPVCFCRQGHFEKKSQDMLITSPLYFKECKECKFCKSGKTNLCSKGATIRPTTDTFSSKADAS